MALAPGRYELGPDNAELLVHTKRAGAAARAGHDLVIEVTAWNAVLAVDENPPHAQLTADGGSLRVRQGTGGITTLSDDDKAGIGQTIDEEVLKRSSIEFRSTNASPADNGLRILGELTLLDSTHPVEFELTETANTRVTASATFKQSDWGIKPYSTLFGTLKVADEITVTLEADLSVTG